MQHRNRCGLMLVATLFILLFGCHQTAVATTWYVSTTGNDATGSGSKTRPWKTLHHACQIVKMAGDTIRLSAGTFQETAKCYPASGVNIAGNGNTGSNPTLITGTWNDGSYAHFGWMQDGIIVLPTAANGNSISSLILDGNDRTINMGLSTTRLPNAAWNDHSTDSNHITIHDVTARNFACIGIWFNDTRNSNLYRCRITESATDDPNTVLGALTLGGLTNCTIHDVTVICDTVPSGYGIKAFGRPLNDVKLYNLTIHVKPLLLLKCSHGGVDDQHHLYPSQFLEQLPLRPSVGVANAECSVPQQPRRRSRPESQGHQANSFLYSGNGSQSRGQQRPGYCQHYRWLFG